MSLEFIRKRNQDTYIVFPLIDDDGDTVPAASNLDSEYIQYADDSAPIAFADCNFEAQELGATGVYYLHLLAAEVNAPYIEIQVKSDEAKTQHLGIRTIVTVPTPEEIAESVWEELLAEHQTAASFGRLIQEIHYHSYMDREIVFAAATVVDQGITQDMLDYGTLGVNQGIIQYEIVRVAIDRDFAAPDFTFYVLWKYDANGRCIQKKASTGTVW